MNTGKIPTDPVGAVIWGIDLAIEAFGVEDAYKRLQSGIAARAQAEGRDVSEDEESLLDALLARSEQRRDGKA